MKKHFEDVWIEAEDIAHEFYADRDAVKDAEVHLAMLNSELDDEVRNNCIGEILLSISFLSKKYNINVWTALEEAILDKKLLVLDPEIKLILENS